MIKPKTKEVIEDTPFMKALQAYNKSPTKKNANLFEFETRKLVMAGILHAENLRLALMQTQFKPAPAPFEDEQLKDEYNGTHAYPDEN